LASVNNALLAGKQTEETTVPLECMSNFDEWGALRLGRLCYDPKSTVVSERLNNQESLSVDHEFAEVIWTGEPK
jgi:hypothetical protein